MKIERQAGFLIAKVHQLSGRLLAKKMKKYRIDDINPAQGRILFALWQKDDISINELAKRTQLEKSTLTSMLDRLADTGYLTRVPSANDRRKIHIKLTDKDRSLREAYLGLSTDMTETFYRGFTDDEITRFEESLKKILENLITESHR